MNTILLALITIVFIVAVGIFISVMIEVKSTTRALREFLKSAETSLKPALEELQLSLKSMRGVTDNVTDVTEDAKKLSSSVRRIGEDVERVSDFIEGAVSSTAVNVSGWKAGIRAGLEVLFRNLFAGKGKQ